MPQSRGYSRPELHLPVTLKTAHAQKVVDRDLLRVARALYAIDVVLHAIGNQDEIEQVEALVDGLIGDFAAALDGEIARLREIKADRPIVHTPVYKFPLSLVFRISSPQLAQYANAVQTLDTLIFEMDTLWLNSLVSNRMHSNASYEWRSRLLALGRQIVEIERRARAAAVRKGKGAEIAAGDAQAESVVALEDGGMLDDER